jgi:hypothetical protein
MSKPNLHSPYTARQVWPWLFALGLLLYTAQGTAAENGNQAALIIRFSDDRVESRCVEFAEPQISGYDLLLRSGLPLVVEAQGMGALVCAIEEVGCPSHDCLCQCQANDCVYWSYWQRQEESEWRYAAAGASQSQVKNGDIQRWSWGLGGATLAAPPPPLSFADVCGADDTAVSPPIPDGDNGLDPFSYLIFFLIVTALGWLTIRAKWRRE